MARVVTNAQMRAARALVDWSVRDLAERSGVHRNTITNFETGRSGGDPDILARLCRALEAAGVVFVGGGEISDTGGPGVRVRARRDEGLRPDQLTSENDG